ncbi:MAG: FkbM family methyltransferase [Pseudomonadota bacterium]
MTFLSYSQNFEDVLIWRALGHVKNGFYIDVGANDPVEHSVTRAFYDAGWHGINIEPLPSYLQKFVEQRPRDINLAIAAGAADGSLTLFDVPAVNGWASPDAAVADAHRARGYAVTEQSVPVRTLAGVCAEHAPHNIHFLKIDVEGFEGEVLKGMDFTRFRPWLLVIEATLPNSRVSNHAAWEDLVTPHRYSFVYFDGLNRYYVSEEHAELAAHFGLQPNVFDDFIPYHLDAAWKANTASEAAAQAAAARAAEAADKQWQAEKRAEQAHERAAQSMALVPDLLAKYDDINKQVVAAVSEREAFRARLEQRDIELRELDARLAKASREAQQQAQAAEAALRAQGAAAEAAMRAQDEALQAQLKAADAALRAHAERADAALRAAADAADAALHAQAAAAASAAQIQADNLRAEMADQLSAQAAAYEQRLAEHHVAAQALQGWGRELEARLLATLASTSWRVTAPLRYVGRFPHYLRAPETRQRARSLLRRTAVRFTANESMRRLFIPLLLRSPALAAQVQEKLRAIKQEEPVAPVAAPAAAVAPLPQMSDELRAMPATARKVFADLQRMRHHSSPQ